MPTLERSNAPSPPVCDYEGSRYASEFWTRERRYEDMAERVALKKLLPRQGQRIVEIGAGAGRLADLYAGYDQIVLMDYAHSVLVEARQRWGSDVRFCFVAADVYELPFVPGAFDALVMVRVMHHLVDVSKALAQLTPTLRPGASCVIEYANKRNLKAIARWVLRRQAWSPFEQQPYEFAELNFDFHPAWMTERLREAGLAIARELTVSHFRLPLLKRLLPPYLLASLDGLVQGTGRWWKLSPSIFVQAHAPRSNPSAPAGHLFKCTACGTAPLLQSSTGMTCPACRRVFPLVDGVYDFK